MLVLKYLLLFSGGGMLAGAAAILIYDIYQATEQWRLPRRDSPGPAPPVRWRSAGKLAVLGLFPLLLGLSIVVIPSGMGGVRVSQLSGTRPGTLYAGSHGIVPLIERVAVYNIHDQLFTTAAGETKEKDKDKVEVLKVQTREGLQVGLGLTVRYRIDPKRLDHIHANLPQPVERELVPPVVASVFREVVPNYLVREVFSSRREEIRRLAAEAIARRLATDGIVFKEVMLRDIRLPAEYEKGLEGILLKEQENERLAFEVEIKQKLVRTAELEAEADKARLVKRAEGDGQVRVLQAKAEADAMQHTLPLKEKQIQQTRLESEARKEAMVKNAEAAAVAKVTDSKAELERRKLLAEAEGYRIRVTSNADSDRLKLEAAVLKQNPLLIQKIIAERLSDKVQIMMVPTDGKFFFNDVLRAAPAMAGGVQSDPPEDPPVAPAAAQVGIGRRR